MTYISQCSDNSVPFSDWTEAERQDSEDAKDHGSPKQSQVAETLSW